MAKKKVSSIKETKKEKPLKGKASVSKKTGNDKLLSAKKNSTVIQPEILEDLAPELDQELATETALKIETDEDFIHEPPKSDDDLKDDIVTKSLALRTDKSLVTTDPLILYLNEIRKYPVLSKEEELEVAKKYYETKDPAAAETLVRSNLRFVVKVAAEYSKFGSKMIDLIQEGNVGLLHAVKEYNPYKGARLITYAVWWIRGYIQEYLMRQYSMVRIGTTQNQRKLFYQLQKEKESLGAIGLEPTIAMLSHRLGIPEDEVAEMAQRMSGRDISLDRPVDDDSPTTLKDLQGDTSDELSLDERIEKEEQLDHLKKAIESLKPELSERELIILNERILNDEPLTLQEIGEKHNITREAVRQMEARVMNKIKNRLQEIEKEPEKGSSKK